MKNSTTIRPSVKRRIALLLFISVFISVISVFPSFVSAETPIIAPTEVGTEPIETAEQTFARITADSMLLSYIDETAFRAAGHVNRLPEEEDLNSYVFENADGTRTAYILSEAVKYVDSTGAVKEKNLTLSQGAIGEASLLATTANSSAYTITATNTPMTFPQNLSQSVRFTYGDYTIRLRPETVSATTVAMQADGKMLYRNAFGSSAHLMYTPQLSGLKEDIVLTHYTGTNTFAFVLDTDGLIPASDAGGYYLWDGNNAEMQIRLGQVVSYDASGSFSIGEMEVVHLSGTSYRVTLTVDPVFLANAAYPVTVDPTLTVNDADTIWDAPVFSGIPASNFGTFQYNTVGNAGGSYLQGMTAVKLPGLYESTSFDTALDFQITSAKFYVKEASGTAAQTVNLYPITTNTTWTETSATWNLLQSAYDTSYACTASLGSNATAYFDITDLVVKWKNETYNPAAGFVLISVGATANKNFHSGESTTTSARPYVQMSYTPYIVNTSAFGVAVGESKAIPTTTLPSSVSIAWTSSDTSVATVTSAGYVTGVSMGTTTLNGIITYLDDGSTSSCSVPVNVVPFKNGTYYIQNKETGKFATKSNDKETDEFSTESNDKIQESLTGKNVQRWEFTYSASGEYYTIKSIYIDPDNPSANYLATKVDAAVDASPATLLGSTSSQYARWVITDTTSGAYKLQTVAQKNTYYALTVSETSQTSDGAQLVQRAYHSDSDYDDEWNIIEWHGAEIELFGQEMSKWCWAACTQMATLYYSGIKPSQSNICTDMHGAIRDLGCVLFELAEILNNSYCIGYNFSTLRQLVNENTPPATVSQTTANTILSSGNIMILQYDWIHYPSSAGDVMVEDSHVVVVVCGYLQIGNTCWYVMHDPWPLNEGDIFVFTYDQLCEHNRGNETYTWVDAIIPASFA